MIVGIVLPDGSLQTFENINNIGFFDRSHTIRATDERTVIINPAAVVAVITDEIEVAP